MSDVTENNIENRACELYEAVRKLVGGRPAWEELNQSDPHDMSMRITALELARAEMVLNSIKPLDDNPRAER